MTTIQYRMVQGDEEPSIRLKVDDGSGQPVDLSDVTTVALLHSPDGKTWTTITGGGSVEQVGSWWHARYDWQDGDTDALAGSYQIRLRLTRSNGRTLTVPSAPPWVQLMVFE